MKLRATTLLYIAVNAILLIFRTVQITAMTTPETAFLDDRFSAIGVIGAIVAVLLFAVLFVNAVGVRKTPKSLELKGLPSAVACGVTGLLFLISGIVSLFDGEATGKVILFVLSLAAAAVCFLFAASSVKNRRIPKAAPLLLLALWLGELVFSYLFYTTRPLRARTVYETLAMAALIVFFLAFCKAHSGVKPRSNLRRVYSFGLVASTLCFVSIVPEFIATVLGFSEKVSESCVSQLALLGAGIFTAFVSLYCFRPVNKPRLDPSADEPSARKTAEDLDVFEDISSASEAGPEPAEPETEPEAEAAPEAPESDGFIDFYIPDEQDRFKK